jgi:thioredoxin reductase
MRFALATSDGEYRCRIAVFAVGVADPWNPAVPGIEHARHYAEVGEAASYAGKRVVIMGKANSGFELATGLLPHARWIVLVSPSPAKLSVVVNSLVGVRARYILPFEDFVLGGGVGIFDATPERLERQNDGSVAVTMRDAASAETRVVADEVISATGFSTPLRDLPDLGVATFGHSGLPAQTRWWESATVPGIYFAGTINQGARGLAKFGVPPNSGAVQGHRYNARILARHIAETAFSVAPERAPMEAGRVVPLLLDEATRGPELWHQKGFLARIITVSADTGVCNAGILPLTVFLDEMTDDGVAMTLEADGTTAVYPVAYVRAGGKLREVMLPAETMLCFEAPEYRDALAAAVQPLGLS